MLRVSLVIVVVPAIFGIIVRDPPPSPNDYKYSYNIEDPTTGDSKSQHEVRQGDVVTGAYTVLGPDGTKRTVEYTADSRHGFKAVVREDPASSPLLTHPAVAYQNYDYNTINTIQYQTPRTLYTRVLPAEPQTNYVEEPATMYFTPQNEVEPNRAPFDGHYFIPASNNKLSRR